MYLLIILVIIGVAIGIAKSKKSGNVSKNGYIDPTSANSSYKYISKIDKLKNVSYDKRSKIVSIFTRKWYDVCQKDFVILDFETTGLDKVFDSIIEIAAIRFENGIEKEKYVTLVKPLLRIPPESTAVNHITNKMVKSAPKADVAIPNLIDFIGDSIVIGHNVNFDIGFLEIAAQRQGKVVQYNYIDTMSISKKLFPDLPDYKLGTIAKSLDFDTSSLHRAEADVYVCAEIVKIALNTLSTDFENVSKELRATRPAENDNGSRTFNPQISKITEDLVWFSASRLCPYCSIYNDRVYSKSGRDRRFPSFSLLPNDLKVINCPKCNTFLGFSNYYDLDMDGSLKKIIKDSNRPFKDLRTKEEKEYYKSEVAKKTNAKLAQEEYLWLCQNLPDLAPKSLSGYTRMKNSKSTNYQKIISAANEAGYRIVDNI